MRQAGESRGDASYVYDASLEKHQKRIEAYMRGCALMTFPRERSRLREELVAFLTDRLDEAVDEWVDLIGTALAIPKPDWGEMRQWMREGLTRWIQHIGEPEDVETYVYLRQHARHAFVSGFPASRFLAGQTKLFHILCAHLRSAYRQDRAKREELLTLLSQEFQERILHISDFFVEAREQELREQEASYQKAVDNAPAVIFRIDQELGTIWDANQVAERTLRYPRQELVGKRIWDLIPAADRARAARLFEETKRSGHSTREDLHLVRSDGELVPMFFNGGILEYRHELFFHVICVDLTDRKRLESQLIQSEKMAAIGQLAAGIAHEIRNPLGIIMNALYDLAEIVDSDNPEVKEDLRIAKEEMGRVQAIINNLLEFSRESRAETEQVDVNELLRRTLQLMNRSLLKSNIRVASELGEIGSCVANQNALRQIFLNLITNAVQAMPDGGVLTVRTSLQPERRVHVEVEDTGVGIPPEHLNDIFNPFFTTKAPGQGTGLGLSVVHSVVKRYNGEIQVRSQVGRGTTFAIEFPCPCDAGFGDDGALLP
jgi:PAS domain S-box-containing protein